jgi:hypothetical protein
MRDPHVRFCERHGGAIPRAYSTRWPKGQRLQGISRPGTIDHRGAVPAFLPAA